MLVLGDLTFGLCLFAVVAFLDLLPELGGSLLSFSKIIGFLLALSWLAKVSAAGGTRSDFLAAYPLFTYVLGLFLAWTALSLLWSEDPSLGRTPLMRFALNLVLFLIVYTAVRTPRQFTWTVGAYVAGATVAAAYGLLSPPQAASYTDVTRVSGTIGDPNELASALVPGMILAGTLAVTLRHAPLVRLLCACAGVLCGLGVFLSLSRGGLVALAVALLVSLFAAGRWRAQALVLVVLVCAGAFTYYGYFASHDAAARVTEFGGGTGRTDLWTVGWRMVQDKPVTGVGVGNFQRASIHYLLEPGVVRRDEFIVDTPKVAHNTYLQTLAELGAVGLALFLAIIGFAVACVVRAARVFASLGERDLELMTRGLLVALAGVLAADFFITQQFSKQLWLLLGLGPGLLGVARALAARGGSASPDQLSEVAG